MKISTQVTFQETAFIKTKAESVFKKLALGLKKMKSPRAYKADLDFRSFEQLESKKTLHSFKNLM